MGLDLLVIVVTAVFAIHGYRQGFLKGASWVLTPVIGVWLILRNSRTVAGWLGPSSPNTIRLVIAVVIILAVTYVAVRILGWLLAKLFDRVQVLDLDQFLGGALGLLRATAILWVILTVGFVVYPSGRKAISHSPLCTQILSLGNGLPFVQRKADEAHRYVAAFTDPLKRWQLPTQQGMDTGTLRSNLRVIEGLDLD